MNDKDCIFCKIIRGEIPSTKVYEDEEIFAFNDIRPSAPVHVLVIPKQHVATLYDCDASYQPILGKLLAAAPRIARDLGCNDGFRTIINTGRIGRQEVYHLHLHILSGPEPLQGPLVRG